jgi:CHAD domain-containing protein
VVSGLHLYDAMFADTPHQFAAENVRLIRQQWRGVRDGDPESIHQARIATRRVRAALNIVDRKETERVELCRALGRMLGKVRDLDITQEVFQTLSMRLPAASCAIAAARRAVERDQQHARRRFAKALDHLELKPLLALRERPSITAVSFWKDWRRSIAAETLARQQALSDAIDRAPAVYMPNRVHRVRIATKKLRYALEVGEAAGIRVNANVMRDLRKTQDLLGRIHDIDVARGVVRHLNGAEASIAAEAALLDAVMAADCSARYEKYLARRERLQAACDYCSQLAVSARRRWSVELARRTLPAAGAVALPIAMWRLAAGREGSRA